MAFLCHRKLRPMTQKRSAGCALARKRNMSQATALGARMCPGTFFLTAKNMSVYADQNHAPSLTDVQLEITGNFVGSS